MHYDPNPSRSIISSLEKLYSQRYQRSKYFDLFIRSCKARWFRSSKSILSREWTGTLYK